MPQDQAYNILRNHPDPNQDGNASYHDYRLCPADGRVGCTLKINGEHYLITSNADYIPVPPSISTTHDIYVRDDMHYGTDDYILWPQQYSPDFPHFAAIPTPHGHPELAIMHHRLEPRDFMIMATLDFNNYTEMSSTTTIPISNTRGLGLVSPPKLQEIRALYAKLLADCDGHRAKAAPETLAQCNALIPRIESGLARLSSFPAPFDKVQFTWVEVQRAYLELAAVMAYAVIYSPRIDLQKRRAALEERAGGLAQHIPVAQTIGAFTSSVDVASVLFAAHLPFWLVRPLHTFSREVILREVHPQLPPPSMLEPPPPDSKRIRVANHTNAKVAAMRAEAGQVVWYRDPFDQPIDQLAPTPVSVSARPEARRSSRYEPYPKNHITAPKGGRDKFEVHRAPEMPDTIDVWANALRGVNRSHPSESRRSTDTHYVLPEPALLVSAESPAKREMMIYHWMLLRPIFHYALTVPGLATALKPQEWRDILDGRLTARASTNKKTAERNSELVRVLSPIFNALGLQGLERFPFKPEEIERYPIEKVKETIWALAETSFRYELVALDERASSKRRRAEVEMCFAGRMLVGIPVSFSQRGFAAEDNVERHRYFARLARLMLDWRTRNSKPAFLSEIGKAQGRLEWTDLLREKLEVAVAQYYTQSFYDLFGRAAVIPMRTSHRIE
ncbi:hypothetical protein R3P38DRAFT_3205150 [Favolaschia claudopus]|uniref:Uncharacterized protein n=1 Tax=Favolaschia claudopus TaxID=2862362 RepID=A0AAW0AQR8_9AGAR